MLITRPDRMYRNKKIYTCREGHAWAYIKAGPELNYGIRICKDCDKRKRIKNWSATMKARERRILS